MASSSFWDIPRPLARPLRNSQPPSTLEQPCRCPDFIGFLAICLQHKSDLSLGLHPFLLNTAPGFDDANMGGGSFDVRKVDATSFPHGLNDDMFKNRKFVVVKHPRIPEERSRRMYLFSDIATELQILRHDPLRNHKNIIDLLAVMYFDAGKPGNSTVVPALVLEYAEMGSVKSYQEQGYGTSVEDKINILLDTAHGLEALHESGIAHGDLKPSNLLVCRDETRKFVVKLTDFGYSFTGEEDHVVGTTQHLDAPEASGRLDPRFFRQLDIYSFGLLLFAVFRNGTQFYDAVDETQRNQIPVLKTSGLLAATTQINLLIKMKSVDIPLLVICKILAYSLQPDPSHRFKSMARIIQLLKLGDPSLPSGTGGSRILEMSVEGRCRLIEAVVRSMKRKVEVHLASFAERSLRMPLVEAIKAEMFQRIDDKSSTLLGNSQLEDHVSGTRQNISTLLRDAVGVHKETALAFLDSSDARNHDIPEFQFSKASMPRLPEISGLLRKMPVLVQNTVVSSLLTICNAEQDETRKSMAHFNLACSYVNGIGTDHNLEKATIHIVETARLNLIEAQSLYIDLFTKLPAGPEVSEITLAEWTRNSAMNGDRNSLEWLRQHSEVHYAELLRSSRLNASIEDCWDRRQKTSGESNVCGNVLDWANWRQSFMHFAIINSMEQLLELMLNSSPELINRSFPSGETPLSLACRYGNAVITKELLRRGADPRKGDNLAATPLHWLIAFELNDQEEIAKLLQQHGANVNAISRMEATAFVRSVFDTPISGTPLHWAVAQNDLTAVDVLLRLGADLTLQFPAESPSIGLNVFEFACSLSRSAALGLFVRDDIGKALVNRFRPLQEDTPVVVNPLFFTLGSHLRWQRLLGSGVNFEHDTRETIRVLLEFGGDPDCVLKVRDASMSAVFATAFHQCNADVMRSGLGLGFDRRIDSTFGGQSSGGNALFLAITHGDRDMLTALLAHGASVNAVDMYGMSLLARAAKESDDIFFVKTLLEAGAPVDPPGDKLQPFRAAVYNGNFKVARYLFEKGADRDRMLSSYPVTVLGDMLHKHTKNAVTRVEFILSLPDRGSDGFTTSHFHGWPSTAFHMATCLSEDSHDMNITTIMVSALLSKYREKRHLDSTDGPDHSTVIGMAVEVGNHQVVRLLLEHGADPNIEDEYGRTPLDKLYWRYCYPATTPELAHLSDAEVEDRLLIKRKLNYVNENTSELLSLLTSFNARANVFRFPQWYQNDPGYRTVDWVMQRLKENRSAEARQRQANAGATPSWGGLPIRVPERPMQFMSAAGQLLQRAGTKSLRQKEGFEADAKAQHAEEQENGQAQELEELQRDGNSV